MKPSPDVAERPSRILIVDDEQHNRNLLEVMLRPEGFLLTSAASGEEAIEVHDEWRPDLVLMDLLMPGMGGLEGVRRLRQSGSKAIFSFASAIFSLPFTFLLLLRSCKADAGCSDAPRARPPTSAIANRGNRARRPRCGD